MAPPTAFSGYPVPEEGPGVEYKFNVESLPVLRGLPLLLGGNLYANLSCDIVVINRTLMLMF